jgi:hypothetical protein
MLLPPRTTRALRSGTLALFLAACTGNIAGNDRPPGGSSPPRPGPTPRRWARRR